MRVLSIGGGPAALFFGILARKRLPRATVRILERNRADETFGWGVVFSRETLSNIASADPECYARIERAFASWDDIETFQGGAKTVSTGHGFVGLSRRDLLLILTERARELGVEIEHLRDVADPEPLRREADLVLGADGVHSLVRQRYAETFRPEIGWGRSRFCWLGTDLPLRAFTFHFKPSPHGLVQVHAYPFRGDLSTWIVEMTEAAWRRAGLDQADEAATTAWCESLFREELAGHRILVNKSIWRSFPTIRCARWSHENVVLMGDAVHTAHFSIGSGTKLAMEDGVALVDALAAAGGDGHADCDVRDALTSYESKRRPEVERLQRAAEVSRTWFEGCERYAGQPPTQFAFNLMTRSRRITWDNLAARDPALVRGTAEWFAASVSAPRNADGSAPPPAFTPFRVRGLELANRLVVSPMCQYMAVDGVVSDWHATHLVSRAIGGAGLVFAEASGVSPDARITPGCAGIWNDEQEAAWARIVASIHRSSAAKAGIQIAHAGRKGSCTHRWDSYDLPLAPKDGGWETIAPSALAFEPSHPVPREMTRADMDRVKGDHAAAARRAARAGFDAVEIHMAHGYLLATFLSPLSNLRQDEYGGGVAGRMRFPLEVLRAVRGAFPADRPVFVRISASDWMPGGTSEEEAVEIARSFAAAGADVIDVSSGGVLPQAWPSGGRMFNLGLADRIRHEAGVPVMAVGGMIDADHANTALAAGRCDLVALARPFLADPYLAARAAARYGVTTQPFPLPYLLGRSLLSPAKR